MYESNRPTKQKRNLYEFMERNKRTGQIGIRKLARYAIKKGFTADVYRYKGDKAVWSDIYNKRGTQIAETKVQKKHVTWWNIL